MKIQVYKTKEKCVSSPLLEPIFFLFVLQGIGGKVKAFASRNSVNKLRKDRQAHKILTFQTSKIVSAEDDGLKDSFSSEDDSVTDNKLSPIDNLAASDSITIPSRGTVLQACSITSGLIAALGIIIRQVGSPFMLF